MVEGRSLAILASRYLKRAAKAPTAHSTPPPQAGAQVWQRFWLHPAPHAALRRMSATRSILLALTSSILISCQSEVRPWQASDHDQSDKPAPPPTTQPKTTQRSTSTSKTTALNGEMIWRASCATCHGAAGRGDGKDRGSMQMPDLTSPAWQQSASDRSIATTIEKGKGKMPPFDLPVRSIKALVAHIRSLKAEPPPATPSASPSR